MVKVRRRLLVAWCLLAATNAWAVVRTGSTAELLDLSLPELMQLKVGVGSRGSGRAWGDSPVPVEVVTGAELEQNGYRELGKVIQRLLPYANFPRSSITDATDHVRVFTLRGLNPDHVLVLLNGKRLHQSAVLNVLNSIGRGGSTVDLNTIPIKAIARIEVLRDGAAAQYGSDAIAGILNIVLRDEAEAVLTSSLGQTRAGDGEVYTGEVAWGARTESGGFLHLAGEWRQRGDTNRAGPDHRQPYFNGDPRNALWPRVTFRFGDAQVEDALGQFNAALPLPHGLEWYAFGGVDERDSEAAAIFRRPADNNNVRAIYPDGFLPLITGAIRDRHLSTGVRAEDGRGRRWEFSVGHGDNRFDFGVEHSLNPSLGTASPSRFDAGGLSLRQDTVNLDGSIPLPLGGALPATLAAGAEWRRQQYHIRAGEPDSYRDGGVAVLDGPNQGAATTPGAQGFPGFQPMNAVTAERWNRGLYVDLEQRLGQGWLTQTALRYEHHSDYGHTLDGKLAASYRPSTDWAWRASVNTGFREPTLAATHYSATISTVAGTQTASGGILPVDHPLAQALGAQSLKPERSRQASLGVTFSPSDNWWLNADAFYVAIDDRIQMTGIINQDSAVWGQPVVDLLQQYGFNNVRFFTNGVDTRTQGFDLGWRYQVPIVGRHLEARLAYHHNDTAITGTNIPVVLRQGRPVLIDMVERARIETGQPGDNINLGVQWQDGAWNCLLRVIRVGAFASNTTQYRADWLVDLDSEWRLLPQTSLALGAHNLFNNYPGHPVTGGLNGVDNPIRYSQFSPYGFDGTFYYARLNWRF